MAPLRNGSWLASAANRKENSRGRNVEHRWGDFKWRWKGKQPFYRYICIEMNRTERFLPGENGRIFPALIGFMLWHVLTHWEIKNIVSESVNMLKNPFQLLDKTAFCYTGAAFLSQIDFNINALSNGGNANTAWITFLENIQPHILLPRM